MVGGCKSFQSGETLAVDGQENRIQLRFPDLFVFFKGKKTSVLFIYTGESLFSKREKDSIQEELDLIGFIFLDEAVKLAQ